MAKINIGSSFGSSKLALDASLANNSQFEITIGEGRDMSTREIVVIERSRDLIAAELTKLKTLTEQAVGTNPTTIEAKQLKAETDSFASTAAGTIGQRKWLGLSLSGILASAKSFGEAAKPVAETALKVMEIFQSVHGK